VATDPSIPLQFHSPQVEQVSPLQSIATLMQLRGQMAEIPLRLAQAEHTRQQAAQEAIATEQKQRQLQDETTLKEIMGDPVLGPKIAGGDTSPLRGRVDEGFRQTIDKNIADSIKARTGVETEKLKNRDSAMAGLDQMLGGIGDLPPDEINSHIQAAINNPANQILFQNAGIDPQKIPQIQDAKQLKDWQVAIGQDRAITNAALASKEKQAETDKKVTDAATAAAEAPVKAAIAQATLANPQLLNPEQAAQDAARKAAEQHQADAFALEQKRFVEAQRHNKAEEGLSAARLAKEKDDDKILSPVEAATLGVAYGTTKQQAAKMNLQPSTQAQNTVAGYAARIRNSSDELDRLDVNAYERNAPSFMNTAKGQQFDQAQRDFINAVLRRESGAVINSDEFDNAYKQYIPKTGDSPEVLQQKKNNRELQFAAFKRAAGNAYQDPAKTIKKANKVTVTAPDGSKHDFDNQAQADAFKKLAHIP